MLLFKSDLEIGLEANVICDTIQLEMPTTTLAMKKITFWPIRSKDICLVWPWNLVKRHCINIARSSGVNRLQMLISIQNLITPVRSEDTPLWRTLLNIINGIKIYSSLDSTCLHLRSFQKMVNYWLKSLSRCGKFIPEQNRIFNNVKDLKADSLYDSVLPYTNTVSRTSPVPFPSDNREIIDNLITSEPSWRI